MEGLDKPALNVDKVGHGNVIEVDVKVEEMFDQADDMMINQ